MAVQFLLEALMLALAGGLGGVLLGAGVTAVYSRLRGWDVLIPTIAISGGLIAALVIGAVAGLYPAMRASRLVADRGAAHHLSLAPRGLSPVPGERSRILRRCSPSESLSSPPVSW